MEFAGQVQIPTDAIVFTTLIICGKARISSLPPPLTTMDSLTLVGN